VLVARLLLERVYIFFRSQIFLRSQLRHRLTSGPSTAEATFAQHPPAIRITLTSTRNLAFYRSLSLEDHFFRVIVDILSPYSGILEFPGVKACRIKSPGFRVWIHFAIRFSVGVLGSVLLVAFLNFTNSSRLVIAFALLLQHHQSATTSPSNRYSCITAILLSHDQRRNKQNTTNQPRIQWLSIRPQLQVLPPTEQP